MHLTEGYVQRGTTTIRSHDLMLSYRRLYTKKGDYTLVLGIFIYRYLTEGYIQREMVHQEITDHSSSQVRSAAVILSLFWLISRRQSPTRLAHYKIMYRWL